MNDNDNNSGEIEAETDVESAEKKQSIGQVLQAARLAQVMSTQDVARQLRLSEKQVTAIEEDNHSKFPNQTFLRGFIRNYAKLVREDTEEFSQLLQQTFPPVSTQAISYPVDGTPFTPDHKQSRGNIIIVLVAVLVSLLLIYEVYRSGRDDHQADTNIENGTIAETKIQFEAEVEQVPKDDQNQLPSVINSNGSNFNSLTGGAKTDQQESGNTDKEQRVRIVPEVEDKPVKKEGERALRFMFNEESWVEIKDAGGKRIFSQISPGNTEKTVYGRPPFSLTIGNAANVKLVYNAKPVDLIPYTSKHGGVARLSLD
jgi:cytoskeleton protein RodZ